MRQQQPAAPKVETHQGLGLPSVRHGGAPHNAESNFSDAPVAPPRRAGSDSGARRPESAQQARDTGVLHNNNTSSKPAAKPGAGVAAAGVAAAAAVAAVPAAAAAPEARPDESLRRVMKVQPVAEAEPVASHTAGRTQGPEPEREQQTRKGGADAEAPKPKKLSVLEMANNFAQRVEESKEAELPPPKPTIKWARSDKVLRVDGNTVTKASSSAEEYGVAVADALSSGVHGAPLPPLDCAHFCACPVYATFSRPPPSWSGSCARVCGLCNRRRAGVI